MPAATRRPSTTAAAARKSSMRALVHEPMNTLSGRMSRMRMPGSSPMYASARCMPARRTGSLSFAGSGTAPLAGTTCSGEVPQVTIGSSCVASIASVRSNAAPSSLRSVRQYATAASHDAPGAGEYGRPRR